MKYQIAQNFLRIIGDWGGVQGPVTGPTTVEGVIDRVNTALEFFIGFSALVAVIVIVYGAYLMIAAAGDPEKIEKGQKMLVNAVIGMVLAFLVTTIIRFLFQYVIK